MLLLKYNDFAIQHGEHYNKGKTFGHLKIGGLQGLLCLLVTPKETTDTASSASFFDLYLEFDDSGQLSTKSYDKRDDFNFKIINFTNMCSNIPVSPAYGVYISQLISYARASSSFSDFLKRHLHLRIRQLDQGYAKIRLIRSLKKFIFRYQDLVEIYSSLQKRL